ncbi:MAG: tRNA (adenosine(37)-N6)-threonylcarbamoyltransferase complex dimerization subunit type 1 TsaB [Acidobacteria bacterium]|nr:tRNA (adenosine(37)-N6)-threonylcarbamoyltransferase complex dimerization subunit type 1 TsaB [Acidobacteriota bacterium]
MLVLGIETSTPVSSVAIGSEQGLVASMLLARGRGHAEFVVPAVGALCEQSGVDLGSLAGVAVGLGPGLFTGLRVGVATAKTIAQALSRPIIGIPSLDLLAFAVRYSPRLICACADAKRGEVFAAFYRRAPGGVQRESEYSAWAPERLAVEVAARAEEVLFVGSGALLYRDRLAGGCFEIAAVSEAFPRAEALVGLAMARLEREEYDSALDLEPLYVRRADAEINWEERGALIRRPERVKIPGRAVEGNGGRARRRRKGER